MKKYLFSLLTFLLLAVIFTDKSYAATGTFDIGNLTQPNANELDFDIINQNPSITFSNDMCLSSDGVNCYTPYGHPVTYDNSNFPHMRAIWNAGQMPTGTFYILIFGSTNEISNQTINIPLANATPSPTPTPPSRLDLTQLTSNGNGKVTFKILNPPAGFDFSSPTVNASWDNSNWAYSIWYEGGCPNACVVEWVGGGVPFYIRLMDQNSTITFNKPVNGGAFNTPYTQLDLQQLSSDGNGKVTFKILNPPAGFDFSSLSTAGASWDNSGWVYAISYEGGCPDACVVEWQGQTTTSYYVKLANQTQSIIFNQPVSPALNVQPLVTIPAPNPINEGDTYSTTGSFTDPDSTSWTATVNYGDGSGDQLLTLNNDKTFSLSHIYKDNQANNAPYNVSVKITDNQGATGTGTTQVTVNNVAPTPGTVTISPNPVQINTAITATTSFTDPGVLDTHTATANWGDGINTASPCYVTEPGVSTQGSVSCTLSSGYSLANVYPVTITVIDTNALDSNASGISPIAYASVYNPTQGSIFTAGQRFDNPSIASPNTSGKVTFGLSYKYQGGMPTGVRTFSMDFNAANLHFNATTVNSLVVSNGMATLTGTGALNGGSQIYNFFVTGVNGGGIRIHITDSSNNVIYDTQPGDPITSTPTTPVSGHVVVQ